MYLAHYFGWSHHYFAKILGINTFPRLLCDTGCVVTGLPILIGLWLMTVKQLDSHLEWQVHSNTMLLHCMVKNNKRNCINKEICQKETSLPKLLLTVKTKKHVLLCQHLKLEGAQRVHISAKWILYEITGLKDIRITTLNSEGYVTSSMTSSVDLP